MKELKKKSFYTLFIIILLSVSFIGLEISYRVYLHFTNQIAPIILKKDEVLKKSWFSPHPFLIYVFKPNNKFRITSKKYGNNQFTINRFGFRSTLEYDVKSPAKAPNTFRVAVLGGSTAMGVNSDNEVWPYLIGKSLAKHYPDKKIEVLNEGIMGYTSLENLIDLEARVIDFNCDAYLIYLGINDYFARAPADIYRSDYAHFRKTLWESLGTSYIELLPGFILKSKGICRLLYSLGAADRAELLSNVTTREFRRSSYKGKKELISNHTINMNILRNVKSMVGIIRSHSPKALILLSSLYYVKEPDFVPNLNSLFRAYGNEAGLIFTDPAGKMPHIKKMAYDNIHFSKKGDKRMAEIFSESIINSLEGL